MLFKRKKETPVEPSFPIPDPLPDEYQMYFKVVGTQYPNDDGTHRQDVLLSVAEDIKSRVDSALLYHKLTDEQIKDTGVTVDEIDRLRYYMSIKPTSYNGENAYLVSCKYGDIGFMPKNCIEEYEAIAPLYKKVKVNVTLGGGKAKFYNKDKKKICFEHRDYEAKARVYFSEPL